MPIGCRPGGVRLGAQERIHDPQKLELMEVRISRADLEHAVLFHQDRDVQVVHRIPAQTRLQRNDLLQHGGMTVGGHQDVRTRLEQSRRRSTPPPGL